MMMQPPLQAPQQQDSLEKLPAGCDPDTIRLFIGHIPPDMPRADLDALVAQHGQVTMHCSAACRRGLGCASRDGAPDTCSTGCCALGV